MNRLLRATAAFLVCTSFACLTGCEDGGASAGTGGDEALVGSWKMTSMSVNGSGYFAPSEIGWDVQLQIDSDGSLTATEVWEGKTESSGGGWTVTDTQLDIAAGDYDWTGSYSVSSSRFTLSDVSNYDDEGDTGSFVFTRQ